MKDLILTPRTVTHSGICFHGQSYAHPALPEHVGQTVYVVPEEEGDRPEHLVVFTWHLRRLCVAEKSDGKPMQQPQDGDALEVDPAAPEATLPTRAERRERTDRAEQPEGFITCGPLIFDLSEVLYARVDEHSNPEDEAEPWAEVIIQFRNGESYSALGPNVVPIVAPLKEALALLPGPEEK